jgi:hypothetical protein
MITTLISFIYPQFCFLGNRKFSSFMKNENQLPSFASDAVKYEMQDSAVNKLTIGT